MQDWLYALSAAENAPDSAPILLKGNICDNLKKAAELGYNAIEVHLRETDHLDYGAIRDSMAKYQTAVSMIVTGRLNTEGGVNLADARPYITKAALEGMAKYIDMAANLDAGIVVGWVRGNLPMDKNPLEHRRRLARHLTTVAEMAAEKGVKMNIEVINRYEINTFNTAGELLAFVEEFDVPNCYIHMDFFHMGIEENDPYEALRLCGGRLGYFHAADNTRCYPGAAERDFVKLFKVLREIGYNGYIAVECLPKPDGETAAARALQHLKECCRRTGDR